jgi:UDP-N-acetyl-D-glucosamine dehydrogenase
VGLGYVGLPLALEFAKAGFSVVGLEVDADRVAQINRGESYIGDVEGRELGRCIADARLRATSDWAVLPELDVLILCVPTPTSANKDPDLSAITHSTREIGARLRRGQLVVLESTTYPGTTEEVLLPILAASGLQVGQDFGLAYSPERVDPGNRVFHIHNTPRIVGGVTPRCGTLATRLYESIVVKVLTVSSPRAAEMAKLLENIFRNVNIALVNEMAMLADRMGIDIWEVVEAASTKPFGFMSFTPGPGVGGHCIPVDPVYLSWKAKEFDFYTNFIDLASEVNLNMPYFVVQKIGRALGRRGRSLRGARILVLGVTFKRDVTDLRNSSAIKLIEVLATEGAVVAFHDPGVAEFTSKGVTRRSVSLTAEALAGDDCVVIHTDHSVFDYEFILRYAPLVVDTRNATKGVRNGREKIIRL